MDFQDLIEYLTPDNRERLTWIGSGVAAVAGATWMIAKAYLNRRRSDQSSAANAPATSQINRTENVSNHGNQSNIANIGGNVNVVQTIGATVSKVAVVMLLVGLLLVAIGIVLNWFISSDSVAAALPQVEFRIGCGTDDENIQSILAASPDEAKSITEFYEIGNQYRNQIIYAVVQVDKPCGACECYRLEKQNALNGNRARKFNPENSLGYIVMDWSAEIDDIPSTEGNLMISTMIYDAMAATHSFFLPSGAQIPRNELYSNDTIRSTVIAYSGPFYAEANYDTGWGYLKLTPLTVVDDNIRRRIRCTQPDLSWKAKLVDRCAPMPSLIEEH